MNLLDFQSILDASTPDGRWNLLQDFLKKNPDWRKKVDRWLTLDPDTAIIQLQADLAERVGIPLPIFSAMLTTEIRLKAKEAIEQLQTLYRERAGKWEARYESGWIELDNDPRPSGHKSIHDYQQQLRAKKKRKRKQ